MTKPQNTHSFSLRPILILIIGMALALEIQIATIYMMVTHG